MIRHIVALLCSATAVLGTVRPTEAQATLKAVYGWGHAARLGRWDCLFVTVADQQTRAAILQVHGAYGVGAAMLVQQRIALQPQSVVYALLFPLNAEASHIVVSVQDEQTGRTLASQVLQEPANFFPAGQTPVEFVATNDPLIGIAGDITDASMIQAQLAAARLASGILNTVKLPASAVGYEGISVLVLAAADLRQLDDAQQRAIVDWAAAGGNLVLIPSADPLPPDGPLLTALPCDIGANQSAAPSTEPAATQPSTLNGRELHPRSDAQTIRLSRGAGWTAYGRRLGLGRIAVLPVNIAPLKFADPSPCAALWGSILAQMVSLPQAKPITALPVSEEVEEIMPSGPMHGELIGRGPRETLAIRHMLERLGATGGHRPHDWPKTLLYLTALFAILGPVDGLILLRLERPGRHWLVMLGWLGLLLCIGGYVAATGPAAVQKVQTFRLIDQVDAATVAMTDLVAVESSRGARLGLSLDEHGWWEPANQSAGTFAADRFVDPGFHQDRQGCRPEHLSLLASEPQSLRGETIGPGAALLEASLVLSRDSSGNATLRGKLSNRSSFAVKDIQIATSAGNCRLGGTQDFSLMPGASIEIDAALSQQPISTGDLPPDVVDIAPDRTDRIAALVRGGDFACIDGWMPDAPAVKVIDSAQAQSHWQLTRAVVPLSK
ncbi:MAG: hypothetical protein ABR964_06815 [Tepidisphaeraceae bacterium]